MEQADSGRSERDRHQPTSNHDLLAPGAGVRGAQAGGGVVGPEAEALGSAARSLPRDPVANAKELQRVEVRTRTPAQPSVHSADISGPTVETAAEDRWNVAVCLRGTASVIVY